MATLLEKLKQGLAATAAPAAPVSETGRVQSLVAAKSGVVGARPQYQTKSLAEETAKQQATQAQAELGEQAGLQTMATTQAFAEQAQRQAQAEQEVAARREESRLQTRLKTENIINELERGKKELTQQQKEFNLEQAGALMRLQSKMYTDRLRLEGEQARLQDAIKFNEELAKSIMEDNIALAQADYEGQKARDLSDREFDKMLAQMGAYEALQMAQANAAQAEKQAVIQGVGEVAKTSVAGYGTYTSAQKSGDYDQGYQDYKASLGEDKRPMGYKAWQKEKQKDIEATGPGMEA